MPPIAKTLVAALILASTNAAWAQDDGGDASLEDIPHITIVGTAHTEIAPDIATLTLGVTTEKPGAAEAANENARKAQAVIDAAKAQGIVATDIATQSVQLTQTFDEIRDPEGRIKGQKPRGFAAANIIAIRVRDLAKAGVIAETLIAKGADRFDGIAFAVEHPDPILEKLTGEAVRNARTLAQIAAQAAGIKLGRVLVIQHAGAGEPMRVSRLQMKRAVPAASMPIEPGTGTFETSIKVTWAIE